MRLVRNSIESSSSLHNNLLHKHTQRTSVIASRNNFLYGMLFLSRIVVAQCFQFYLQTTYVMIFQPRYNLFLQQFLPNLIYFSYLRAI
jgi:hypothetical protein